MKTYGRLVANGGETYVMLSHDTPCSSPIASQLYASDRVYYTSIPWSDMQNNIIHM